MPNPKLPATEINLFSLFTSPLNENNLDYMVTGSVAAMVYGEPRLTHDIDLVLALKDEDIPKLEVIFPAEDFYCPPPEVIRLENQRGLRGHFNLIHHETGFKADVYTFGKAQRCNGSFPKKRKIDFAENFLWIAAPEYVILKKLLFFSEGKSEKHLHDIGAILRNSGEQIDFKELEQKIEENQLRKIWRRIEKPS